MGEEITVTSNSTNRDKIVVKQISINAQRTINLGNYESMQVGGQCTIDVGENASMSSAREMAIKEVVKQMEEAFKAVKPKGK